MITLFPVYTCTRTRSRHQAIRHDHSSIIISPSKTSPFCRDLWFLFLYVRVVRASPASKRTSTRSIVHTRVYQHGHNRAAVRNAKKILEVLHTFLSHTRVHEYEHTRAAVRNAKKILEVPHTFLSHSTMCSSILCSIYSSGSSICEVPPNSLYSSIATSTHFELTFKASVARADSRYPAMTSGSRAR